MYQLSGISFGHGMVHGKVLLLEQPPSDSILQSLSTSESNLLIAFRRIPDITTFIKIVNISGIRGFIIPQFSPYSHLAWAIAYYDTPTISVDINLLSSFEKLVYLDLDGGFILQPENQHETKMLVEEEAIRASSFHLLLNKALLPAISKSGTKVQVLAQIQSANDVALAFRNGADGVGEIKSEILLASDSLNSEITSIINAIQSLTNWVNIPLRFFDFTIEKPYPDNDLKFNQGPLEYRGVRLLEFNDSLFNRFITALEGIDLKNLIIILPMVTSVTEVKLFRKRLGNLTPRLGVLIETPAAALSVNSLLKFSDSLVIGLNDLTQYTMAWDRTIPHQDRLPPNKLAAPVAKLISGVCRASAKANIVASLALDLQPNDSLVQQIITLQIKSITVSPRLIPIWKDKIRNKE